MFEITLLEKNDPIKRLQISYLQQLLSDPWNNVPKVKDRLEQIQLTPLTADHLKIQFVAAQLKIPSERMNRLKSNDILQHTYQRLCWETAEYKKGIYPMVHAANPFMTHFLIIDKKGRKLEEKTDQFIRELQQNMVSELKQESIIGIGAAEKGLKRLKNGYITSMLSWSQNAVSPDPNDYGSREMEMKLPLAFPGEMERKLIQLIESSDRIGLHIQLEALFVSDKEKRTTIVTYNLLALRMLLLLSSIARKFECRGSSLQKYLWNCQMTLSKYTSREELLEMLEELAQLVMEVVWRTRFSAIQHIEAVRKYVEEHFCHELTVPFLAELFHMNEPCLTELFKEHIGISLSNYVLRLRISKAEQLLQEHELKLSDIAKLVGYSDVEHFTYCFKKFCGESPKEYRARYLQRKLIQRSN